MSLLGRYFLYLLDCLLMLALLGVNVFIFTGENPFAIDPSQWLNFLLDNPSSRRAYWFTIVAATLYWTIVDFNPEVAKVRGPAVRDAVTHQVPPLTHRLGRSFVKAFTLFGASILYLFPLLNEKRLFLHDYLTGTERA